MPSAGVTVVNAGGWYTVKSLLLRPAPSAVVTTTLPVVAPVGKRTVKTVAVALSTGVGMPLKRTVLADAVAANRCPVRVTSVPARPCAGVNWVSTGEARTVG